MPEDDVRKRAHALWEEADKPQGREQEFWLEAERQLGEAMVQHELRTT
ncbi:DUF2934 domain-containing protein [Bradyrhizobium japonicum]|nr:DUF2934 domain-containing protein [Bradyrhizobium japonicum]MBR0806819.1 DUF2934 domain-containing protein [Bradyrhizobium japonicum]UQE02718.1 DUF2934 domain-containing protein [Bradyrhizobium japonicum]WLB23770.1 DUF2934 domain-containing protein [Bradyrhizobium japonicum]